MSKIKKIFIIICMFLFATTISSCKKKEENPTYDVIICFNFIYTNVIINNGLTKIKA